MRRHPSNDYRWYEVPYMAYPLSKKRPKFEPFELKNISDADEALASGMSSYQFAHKPEPIDDENEDVFIDRWLKIFTQAYRGRLRWPSNLSY